MRVSHAVTPSRQDIKWHFLLIVSLIFLCFSPFTLPPSASYTAFPNILAIPPPPPLSTNTSRRGAGASGLPSHMATELSALSGTGPTPSASSVASPTASVTAAAAAAAVGQISKRHIAAAPPGAAASAAGSPPPRQHQLPPPPAPHGLGVSSAFMSGAAADMLGMSMAGGGGGGGGGGGHHGPHHPLAPQPSGMSGCSSVDLGHSGGSMTALMAGMYRWGGEEGEGGGWGRRGRGRGRE